MTITLALPSKGRLKEQAVAVLEKAGLPVFLPEDQRRYRAHVEGRDDIEIVFLSAAEIASELGSGGVDLGVTGEDLIRETLDDADRRVEFAARLGFGHADVVVAVPEVWLDVTSMSDLNDVAADFRQRHGRRMRVATKYLNLTRRFFARYGVTDYRIVESLGATEGTPAAGAAELIVDITSTGATIKANGLRVLDDGIVLQSEANLIASKAADWTPSIREAENEILAKLAV
jgi:ATP phosphoribosyltransferase